MVSKIYCGIKEELPRGYSKRGSMLECAKKRNGIMYFGIKKVDDNIIAVARRPKVKEITSSKLLLEITSNRGRLYKMKKDYPYEKDPQKKKEIRAEFEKIRAKIEDLKIVYNQKLKEEEAKSKKKRVSELDFKLVAKDKKIAAEKEALKLSKKNSKSKTGSAKKGSKSKTGSAKKA